MTSFANFVSIEPLEARQFLTASVAPAPLQTVYTGVATAQPAVVAIQRVFLTGNSMTDGVSYGGLATMLGRGGTSVSLGRQTGPGFSQWANVNLYPGHTSAGFDPKRPGATDPWGNYQSAFAAAPWDVLTLQPTDRRHTADVYNRGQPTEHDEGEVPNSMLFLRAMAANNPNAQVYIYSRAARRTDVTADMTPTGRPFDYATEWLKTYSNSAANNLPFFSRSAVQQLMPLLRSAQAADAATAGLPPVKLIPVGEAYYNIDQAIKAGKFAGTGVDSIYDLYRDQSHPTDDVAAYVIALSFYASLTGQDPRGVAPAQAYLGSGRLNDPKLQALLQQAVYDAITSSHYSGYTTQLPDAPPPPPPPDTGIGRGTSTINGYVIEDKNGSGTWSSGEIGIPGRVVWIDRDNDNVMDDNEPHVATAAGGKYTFSQIPAGTWRVRQAPVAGWTPSAPAAGAALSATVSIGQTRNNVNFFGRKTAGTPTPVPTPTPTPTPGAGTATYRAYVTHDKNGDGKWNNGELGISGRTVWIDLDNDAKLDSNEPTRVTGQNGMFEFTRLAAGSIAVHEVLPTGWAQTSPTSNAALRATLTAGQTRSGQHFAVKAK